MPVRNATTIRPASCCGWIPDLPDQRDQLYAKLDAVPKKLRAEVDLRSKCSPIEDQGQLCSCTMPYAYLSDRNLSDDFLTMRKLAD